MSLIIYSFREIALFSKLYYSTNRESYILHISIISIYLLLFSICIIVCINIKYCIMLQYFAQV